MLLKQSGFDQKLSGVFAYQHDLIGSFKKKKWKGHKKSFSLTATQSRISHA